MEKLADYIEERNALRGKVMTAFIYPVVVACVSVIIVVFLLGYVVPQVVSAFSHAKQQLPMLTRVMLALSDYVREWGLVTGAALVAAFALWRYALRAPAARTAWHARVLRLPLVGRFVLGVNAARFASTLSILCGSGVALLTSLEAARRTLSNDVLRQAVDEASARVREARRYRPRWARRRYSQPAGAPDRQRREDRPAARAAGPWRAQPVARPGAARHGHDRAAGAGPDPGDGRFRAADRAGGDDADPGDEPADPLDAAPWPAWRTARMAVTSSRQAGKQRPRDPMGGAA